MAKSSTKYIDVRCKVDDVFDHYAQQSTPYKQANIAQRLNMKDRFYHLSMDLLQKIIGPFDVMK